MAFARFVHLNALASFDPLKTIPVAAFNGLVLAKSSAQSLEQLTFYQRHKSKKFTISYHLHGDRFRLSVSPATRVRDYDSFLCDAFRSWQESPFPQSVMACLRLLVDGHEMLTLAQEACLAVLDSERRQGHPLIVAFDAASIICDERVLIRLKPPGKVLILDLTKTGATEPLQEVFLSELRTVLPTYLDLDQ